MILQNISRRYASNVLLIFPLNLNIFFQLCFFLKDFIKIVRLLWAAASIYGLIWHISELSLADLSLMLLVANLANTKWWKTPDKWLNPWHMGTHLKVLSESYPMNTSMTGLRWFSEVFRNLCILALWTKVASTLEGLTLMLLVANLANTKWWKKLRKWLKPWQMGTHMRVLSESYPMSTNMTGFRWFSEVFRNLCILVLWTKVASALEGSRGKLNSVPE